MARESFTIDLRFDGGREVERSLQSVGDTGEKSLTRLSQSSKPARRGLFAVDEASRAVQGSVDDLTNRLGPLGGAMRALGPAGTAAAAGIAAVTAGFSALVARAPEATRRIAELGEQADQIGISVQALQELRFAASQVGIEESRLEDGLQELQGRLGELRNEAGPLNSTLEEMGATSLRRALEGAEDTDEALQILIRTLRDSDDSFDAAALAAAAFGDDSGRAIRRLAEQDLPELRQQFRDTGSAIDEDLTDAAREARGEIERLNTEIGNNADAISTRLLPITQTYKEEIADLSGTIRDFVESPSFQSFTSLLANSLSTFNPLSIPGGAGFEPDGDQGDGGARDMAPGERRSLPPAPSPDARLDPIVVESPSVPTPGTKPDTPDGFGGSGGSGGGTPDRLSFAGVDFNDPFTMNDALRETNALFADLEERVREQAEAFARAEGEARDFTDQSRELGNFIAGDLSRSFDRVGDEITRAFVRGEDAAINFGTIAQGVASDLAQTFIELGVTNPLKNAIFGTNAQTLDGLGGFLGDLIPSFGGGATQTPGFSASSVSSGASGGFSFADGGSFTVGAGFPGINAGRDNRLVQFAARDGERVDVRTPKQQGSGGTEVNIINNTGGEVETRRSRKGNGGERLDVIVGKIQDDNIAQGRHDNALQARFGLRPRKAGR